MQDKFGRKGAYQVFGCAISQAAKTSIREGIRSIFKPRWSERILEMFAADLNPKIRGWVNYYTRYNKHEALEVFRYLNGLIRKWLKNKYKLRTMKAVYVKYKGIQAQNSNMFYHWRLGIRE
jgi:hypothetical protein